MKLRRGFKTEASEITREIRGEMGLRLHAPLSPWDLANHLEVPIQPLSSLLKAAPHAVQVFGTREREAFSAVTVFRGSARLIVHNDFHHIGRQASNLAHELSHALLHHPPLPALDAFGCRNWDSEIEDEANWLAGVLLVPEEAALHIIQKKKTVDVAASEYGVTPKMMEFRLNVTGARKRVARWGAYRR